MNAVVAVTQKNQRASRSKHRQSKEFSKELCSRTKKTKWRSNVEKKNVIVHGVSESKADNPEQRVDEDLALLAAMFHEVGVEEIKMENVVRLRKKNSDPAQHPRPMKLFLTPLKGKCNCYIKQKT